MSDGMTDGARMTKEADSFWSKYTQAIRDSYRTVLDKLVVTIPCEVRALHGEHGSKPTVIEYNVGGRPVNINDHLNRILAETKLYEAGQNLEVRITISKK